jgi:hypothetical protein
MAVDTCADLEKLADVVPEPTFPISRPLSQYMMGRGLDKRKIFLDDQD